MLRLQNFALVATNHYPMKMLKKSATVVNIGNFFEIAFRSIEKQIPKKPLQSQNYYYDPCCPACGMSFAWDPYELSEPDFCPYCGQALDWKEDNE